MELHTSCEHCCFKTLDNQEKQVGCQLGRLDKFKEQGTLVETVGDNFLIKNRFCETLRTKIWLRKFDNTVDAINAVYKEITIEVDLIIMILGWHTFDDFQKTLDSVLGQELKPKCLRVVINNEDVFQARVFELLAEVLPEDMEFYVHKMTEISSVNLAFDTAADACKSAFYCVFQSGFIIPKNYLSSIDNSLNRDANRFCALEPYNGNGLFIQHQLHKTLGGNKEVVLEVYEDGELIGYDIIDKAKFCAEKSNTLHMIQKVNDICQNM